MPQSAAVFPRFIDNPHRAGRSATIPTIEGPPKRRKDMKS